MAKAIRRIPLDRRVLVVQEHRIDLRPERGATIIPLVGLLIGLSLFAAVSLFASDLSVAVLTLMLIPGIIIAPLSAMGLLYSLVGAAVIVETKKHSIRFQQGVLGLGLGTYELVPFWKVEKIEVADFELGEVALSTPRPPLEFRAWDIVLVKKSGKRLSIGQVVSATTPDLLDEGFDRALDAAEAIAEMVGSEVMITAEVEEEAETVEATERADAAQSIAEPASSQNKATTG
ncbi:MAG: hypothetical protein IH957_05245 [Chloroflexi bacterium]|nr:hypothetical protein [Chloroflexota bacterium]